MTSNENSLNFILKDRILPLFQDLETVILLSRSYSEQD